MSSYILQLVTDYAERGVALLLDKLRRPRNEAFLKAILAEVQELDDALVGMQRGVDVDTAVGEGLNVIGRILAVPRAGMTDDQYRLRLRVEILVLKSHGTPEDLAAIVTVAWGRPFQIQEYDYATTVVLLDEAVSDLSFPPQLLVYLKRAKAIGTRLLLHFYGSIETFEFAPGSVEVASFDIGFSDEADPSFGGGLLASVIE